MQDLPAEIGGLVEAIVRPLLDYPDDFQMTSVEEPDATIYVEMHVNPEDAGKVIGRQGRLIKALRTLARASASREGYHAEVELLD